MLSPFAEERADVIRPERRLLERGVMTALLHRCEIDDVVARVGRFARFRRVGDSREVALIVPLRERAASGRHRRALVALWKRRGPETAAHVPAFVVNASRRRAT